MSSGSKSRPEPYSAQEPLSRPPASSAATEARSGQSRDRDSATSLVQEAISGNKAPLCSANDQISSAVAHEEGSEAEKADRMLSAVEKSDVAEECQGDNGVSSSGTISFVVGAAAAPARKDNRLIEWKNRIKSVQSTRVTPEVLQRIQEKIVQQTRAKKSLKDCKYLQRANFISSASNTITLQQQASPALFSSLSAPLAAGGAGSARTHTDRSASLMQSMNKRATKSSESRRNPSSVPAAPQRATKSVFAACTVLDDEAADNDEDSEDEQLKELEDQLLSENAAMSAVMSSMPLPPPPGGAATDHSFEFATATSSSLLSAATTANTNPFAAPIQAADLLGVGSLSAVDALLVQLIKEPTEEKELAEKFSLFENMLSTVTTIREQTMLFWSENEDQFVGQSAAECKKRIKAIDNVDSMGIQDDPSKWFVFHMTRQANLNAKNIANVLELLRHKFELLAQELGECPCCLDQLIDGSSTTTLGCCHKLCTDCWEHWLEMKGGDGVFCPLCRHGAFVEELFAEGDDGEDGVIG